MLAMLQDGRVIVVVFVAFLLTGTNSTTSNAGKCRYCKEFIQTLLTRNNLLRISEEKTSLPENFLQNLAQENVPFTSKLDFIQFCMDNCIISGDKTENKTVRSKRDVNEGIYKYFTPPFSYTANEQSEDEVPETVEELEDTADSRKAYPSYAKEKRVGPGCECVKEQEQSVRRLIEMVEKYTDRTIEHFRRMLREEIKNQMLPERQTQFSSIGHQQNYFMISLLTQNPPNPGVQFVTPTTFQPIETTTTGQIVSDLETYATSETKTDLTTTTTSDMPQMETTEYTEETTTEVTIDLPEANVMRQSGDELPPDCEGKSQDSPQYLPAILQAFKPKNT